MGAADIIGKDFKLGLGVELRGFRNSKPLRHLHAVGLLGIGPTMILPWKMPRA